MYLRNRRSVRFMAHDYNGGIYFVTICTADRSCLFGYIAEGVIHLNELGEFAAQNLRFITDHYPYAECPLFVVMPNHIHAIIYIDSQYPHCVGARRASPEKEIDGNSMQKISHHKGLLSVVVGGFKSAVTHFSNTHNIGFAWQRSYYDRIIRDTEALNNIIDYIENNPMNWENDEYNTP